MAQPCASGCSCRWDACPCCVAAFVKQHGTGQATLISTHGALAVVAAGGTCAHAVPAHVALQQELGTWPHASAAGGGRWLPPAPHPSPCRQCDTGFGIVSSCEGAAYRMRDSALPAPPPLSAGKAALLLTLTAKVRAEHLLQEVLYGHRLQLLSLEAVQQLCCGVRSECCWLLQVATCSPCLPARPAGGLSEYSCCLRVQHLKPPRVHNLALGPAALQH